jgi:lipoprotein-anchoring transpeptidase ErfK/SrfK
MGRHLGMRGRLGAGWTRVGIVVGGVCVIGLALVAPAMADDSGDSADDDHSTSDNAPTYESTPCTDSARACVDLAKQRAWLIDDDGKVTRGPVPISSGGPGKETPVGTFSVQWKDKNHKSEEFKDPKGQPARMPFSVFFADGGVAFHGGSVRRASAGCVHLNDADAQVFYDTLQLGDEVQVH